jgi:2TM domain
MSIDTPIQDEDLRKMAITQLRKKREFLQHAVAYVVVNLALNVIWLLTMPDGFYWPVFPLFGWGIGIVFHALDVYSPAPTESKIQREMNRLAHR